MRSHKWYLLLSGLVLLSMVLAACTAPTVTDTAAPPGEPGDTPAGPEETAPPSAATEPAGDFEPLSLAAPDCEYGGIIREIAAVDELTVRFSMCRPDPAFPSKAAFIAFAIQPREWIESAMEDRSILERPIGTGPYMLDSWNRGDSVVFRRFDNYWGEPAITETLIFRWGQEPAARLLELQSGTVDGIDNVGADDFEVVANDPNMQLLERTALNVFYVGFTNFYEPFDDVRVRRAIAMAIDRQRIIDNFFPPGTEIATHFAPCDVPNACVGDPWFDFDPEGARELLAEAGYPDGFSTTLYYRDIGRPYLPEPSVVATDIQAQLAENLNINVTIEVMESGAFLEQSSAGNLNGIHLLGWNADYPHITNFLDYHFSRENRQFGEAHPEIYEPLEQAAQIADPAEAEALYIQANNAIRELVPMLPVLHSGSAVAFRADVEGAHASPLGNEYFAVVNPAGRNQLVWMQNGEPISLYCNDETDGESLRACEQVLESLLAYEVGGTEVKPALATGCEANEELTEWTCTLREGVQFHDGSKLDANDVVMSWIVAWDASHPLHIGNTGAFEYFTYLWGNLLNAEPMSE